MNLCAVLVPVPYLCLCRAKLSQEKEMRAQSEKMRVDAERQQEEMQRKIELIEAESRAKLAQLELDTKRAEEGKNLNLVSPVQLLHTTYVCKATLPWR